MKHRLGLFAGLVGIVAIALGVALGGSGSALAQAPSDVTIAKTHLPATATPGSNVTYTISATNLTPAGATAGLSDTLPPQTTFVSLAAPGGWSCTTPAVGANGTVTCTNANFLPGAAVFTLVVRVLPSVTSAFTNTATIDGEANGRPYLASANDATPVSPQANVVIAKSGPPTIVPGTNISYTIGLDQQGPSDAANAALGDPLPLNTTFISLVSPAGWVCTTPAVGATGTIACTRATFLAGTTASFTLTAKVNDSASGLIINTAQYSQATFGTAPCCASATTNVSPPSADLSISKSDSPDPVTPGANITYTINLVNNGPSLASSVTVTDPIPSNTTFVSMMVSPGYTCTTPPVGGTGLAQCFASGLAAGVTSTFTLVVRVNDGLPNGTVVINTVTGGATTADPSTPNTATATTTVANTSDISITKIDTPDPVLPGGNLTYALTVANSGPQPAPNVRLSDAVPANTTFVSLASPAGWTCTTPPVGATGNVQCDIPSFAAGSPAVFSLVVKVNAATQAGTTISNTATAALRDVLPAAATAPATPGAPADDPNPANNTATATTTVGIAADVAVTKAGAPDAVTAGREIVYTLTASNLGTGDAFNVTLVDTLPSNVSFVSLTQTSGPTFSCTLPVAGATSTVSCTIASLASKASATFTLVVRAGSVTPGPSIVNVATVSTASGDTNPANNSASVTTMGIGQGIPQVFQNPGAIAIVGQPPPRTPTPQIVSPLATQSQAVAPVITPPRTGDGGLKDAD